MHLFAYCKYACTNKYTGIFAIMHLYTYLASAFPLYKKSASNVVDLLQCTNPASMSLMHINHWYQRKQRIHRDICLLTQ